MAVSSTHEKCRFSDPLEAAPFLRGYFLRLLNIPVSLRYCSEKPHGEVDCELPDCPHALEIDGNLPREMYRGPAWRESPSPLIVRCGDFYYQLTFPVYPSWPEDVGCRPIDGRVALVTGGAQGFGKEIASGLISRGCTVYIADLNFDGAQATATELGAQAIPVEVNVADAQSVEKMCKVIRARTGGLDLVISNAGIVRAGSVLEQCPEDFALTTAINYHAFFLITQHCGKILASQHQTSPTWMSDIIQINSKSGLVGSNKNAAYAGSKFGGIGLVQSFALEMVEHGVKVNAICPGNFYDGPLWSDPEKGLFVQYLRSGKVPGAQSVQDVKDFYESKVPMRRGATGIDVLRGIYYLVEQQYETGQALPITGGQVMLN